MSAAALSGRLAAALCGLLCAAGGATLAWFHPLVPLPMLAGFVLASAAFLVWPALWLLIVPALLPLAGLASWSGWLSFEEFDILLLAAAAGGYLRLALAPTAEAVPARRVSVISLALVLLYGASLLLSMQRGFADAGGFHFGWFQGYEEPMNSLRIGKSFFLALLMLPLALHEAGKSELRLTSYLSTGMLLGLTVAALACVWERDAFPGLLNFSDDYRTTALFWEMHVGGAALDGFLALTLPFALREVLVARSPLRLALALVLLALASYACLTTFSRGVYLGVAAGVAVLISVLYARGMFGNRSAATREGGTAPAGLMLVVALAAGACYLAFHSGGYRAMLATLGLFAITLLSNTVVRRRVMGAGTGMGMLPGGLALGVLLAAATTGLALWVDKGAYLSFAAAFVACLTLLLRQRERTSVSDGVLLFATYVWLAVSALLVGYVWGGARAGFDMALVLLLIVGLAVWNGLAPQPLWPARLRWQGGVFGVVLMLAGAIAIFGGGAYMSGRFSTSGQDLEGRFKHWSDGIELLQTPGEWWLGKGLGRFPASYFFSSRSGEFPGSYRLQEDDGNRYLRLAGARYASGYGEYLRISQRVPIHRGERYRLEFDVRAPHEAALHFEICAKHLLYRAGCAMADARVKPDANVWQHVAVNLDGKELSGGHWYAPQLAFFAVALETAGVVADVDNFVLTDGHGASLLPNGDFSGEMAHWFFTSDHHHLPWHIKNIILNVMFDQGMIGLLLFAGLLGAAVWRLTLGGAREHPLAPYLGSALLGCLVVGGFDSLLDVPRVAFLFYFLVLLSLTLGGTAPRGKRSSRPRRRSRSGKDTV